MRLLAVLGTILIQCVATKSWTNDSYSEDAFFVFGWISYLKRISLITLMLCGVILYYVPESRPRARRLCYALIDLTANGLKSALSARESEYAYEKIRSKYHRARYEQSLATQKRVSQEIQNDDDENNENNERPQRSRTKRKICTESEDATEGRERKKCNKTHKEHRVSRHRLRNNVIRDVSGEPCMEIAKPVYFYSDKLDDIQKYLKTNVSGAKRANGSPVENYTLLISGSPRQMAMLDEKYEKNDTLILRDPYERLEYKECGTSTDQLSSKADASSSDQEGPTRDCNDHEMETYAKEAAFSTIPEVLSSRYSVDKSSYQASQFQCGSGCCGSNGCSMSTADLSSGTARTSNSPVEAKNMLKSSRSMVTPKMQKKIEQSKENFYADYNNYNYAGDRTIPINSNNSGRKVDFREVEILENDEEFEEGKRRYGNGSKILLKKLRNEDSDFPCNDVSYYTDRGGEADDENSLHEERRRARNRDLDEEPERETSLFPRESEESFLDYYFDLREEPILKNRLKPALVRAVNWIFGGCPEASRRAAAKRGEVGKEESQGITDGWLL